MDVHNRSTNGWLMVTMLILCVLLIGIASMALLPREAKALPPRPTVPAQPGGIEPSAQAQIQLQVQFPDSWPWQTAPWQDLWTIVQWQDPAGAWRDVDGWKGTLDEVKVGDSGDVTGYKTWWVGGEHMGKGPFRWQVYRGEGGRLLASSDTFDLPSINRATLSVKVPLTR
ncbi:MAG: hypothetical protein JW918_10955 [Anaerolineae bacterium]|nr:hypothetical protein [Anaerolineae bacterium]